MCNWNCLRPKLLVSGVDVTLGKPCAHIEVARRPERAKSGRRSIPCNQLSPSDLNALSVGLISRGCARSSAWA
eukprot:6878204-Pyramimonas_sp.AAC.1